MIIGSLMKELNKENQEKFYNMIGPAVDPILYKLKMAFFVILLILLLILFNIMYINVMMRNVVRNVLVKNLKVSE
jgi:uncharacterized membrane protein